MKRIVVAQTARSWERAAAEEVVAALAAAVTENGRATMALAGGSTPRPVYRRLATRLRKNVAWDKVEIFFGDERCVPPESEESNFHMARESLIEPLKLSSARVHRIEGELDPSEAATRYGAELGRVVGDPPRFDLVLLGLGEDGHTASLFPATPDLEPAGRWVFPTEAPVEPRHRLSLSLSVLNLARRVVFLVRGGRKAEAVARVLAEGEKLPAARVHPPGGVVLWLLDHPASSKLDESLVGERLP